MQSTACRRVCVLCCATTAKRSRSRRMRERHEQKITAMHVRCLRLRHANDFFAVFFVYLFLSSVALRWGICTPSPPDRDRSSMRSIEESNGLAITAFLVMPHRMRSFSFAACVCVLCWFGRSRKYQTAAAAADIAQWQG